MRTPTALTLLQLAINLGRRTLACAAVWCSTVSAGPSSAGYFGALTAEAVKEWQKDMGLSETGAFDGQCRLQYLQHQVRLIWG